MAVRQPRDALLPCRAITNHKQEYTNAAAQYITVVALGFCKRRGLAGAFVSHDAWRMLAV